jgi:two-component system response regulator RegX3
MPRVLLVDDEAPLRESLSYALAKEGYSVLTAADGATALSYAQTERVDAIVLDLMLPVVDGMDVCRQLRKFSDVPVLMLTAKDQPADTVRGLETGADDYVTKPFNTRELLARLAAIVRRRASVEKLLEADRELLGRMEHLLRGSAAPASAPDGQPCEAAGSIRRGPVVIDVERASVTLDGKPLTLAPEEYALLRLLVTYARRVVTRTELIERIWGPSTPERLVMLEGYIRCLRDKIERDPSRPEWLLTIPGIGFQFA